MTEMLGEAWSPMSVPDLAPDDDDDDDITDNLLFASTHENSARGLRCECR